MRNDLSLTRYESHMQLVHNQATAMSIELAILLFTEDILDVLIKTGVKENSALINKVRALKKYNYNALQDSYTKP